MRAMREEYIVKAFWDDEAKVWCAESVNFVGIATSGKNIDQLVKKLKIMVPEILEANHELQSDDVPFQLLIDNIMAHRICA